MDEVGKRMLRILQFYEQWAKQQGLSYNVLAVLHTLVAQGKSTQKQIGEAWHLPKQTVFSICQQLKVQGHIDFLQGNLDKREKTLFLTAGGLAYAQPIVARMQAMENAVFERFGQQESVQLLDELARLSDLFLDVLSAGEQYD